MIPREKIDDLLAQVTRGPATQREKQLALALEQLRSQHDFAFSSWQQSVKRQARLSVELAHATTVELTSDHAKTRVNKGASIPPRFDPETARTRFFRHSGGALIVKMGRAA